MFIFGLRVVNQLLLGRFVKPNIKKVANTQVIVLTFRAWPIDLDFNWHLNNASYLRTAELARFISKHYGSDIQLTI